MGQHGFSNMEVSIAWSVSGVLESRHWHSLIDSTVYGDQVQSWTPELPKKFLLGEVSTELSEALWIPQLVEACVA